MWVVNFVVMRDGERSRDDGSPRFLDLSAPFPVPDIDQTVVHRGEMFVVDDVVWDLERKTVFVEIAPAEEEATAVGGKVEIASGDGEIEIASDESDSESGESLPEDGPEG